VKGENDGTREPAGNPQDRDALGLSTQDRLALALSTLTRVKDDVDAAIELIEGRQRTAAHEPLGVNVERLMTMSTSDDQMLGQLQVAVADVATSVNDLTTRQSQQIKRLTRVSYATTAGLLLHLPLTLLTIFLFYQLESVQDRTSTQVLCPLYSLFLTSYNPNGQTALRDPVAYENNMRTIEQGATTLGCEHRTRGKPK
jgi:hypothetical protein